MNKRINFNIKDRKVLYVILCIVLISTFTLTIAYAALNAVLTISGNAQVTASNWDVHFDNIKVTSGSVAGDAPKITSPTTATFSTTLNTPGEYYEFTIDVVNNGRIDAMIENITKTPTLSASQAKYLKYEITYQNGDSITTNQLVEKNSSIRLKVRIEYRKDLIASDLPTTTETLQLGLQLDYTQSNGNGSIVSNGGKLLFLADGNIDSIGTIVTIGDQQFYTIGIVGDNVKLLSMYNLYVGNSVNPDLSVTPLENPTGKQSELANAWITGEFPIIGATKYSNSNSTYSGSIVEGYVNNYKTILESEYGVDVVEARLISYDELANSETFACEKYEHCSNKYSWIYSTSYWTGSLDVTGFIWYVGSDNSFNVADYINGSELGVRPVIVIPKSQIIEEEPEIITFTIASVSYQAMKGMTWEEWLASDYAPANAYSNYAGANIVISVAGYDIKTSEGTYVTLSDTIISGHAYITGSSSEPR